MSADTQQYEMTANQKDMGGCAMFIAFLIITAVTLYADVMFIQIMWTAFPDGLLRIGGIGGALATGVSILVLMVGKSYWFRPGRQLLAAWAFTGAEVAVSILNVILAFQIAHGGPSGLITYWALVSPATPFVALVGWIVIWQLDISTRMRHQYLEIEERKATSEMAYSLRVHNAQMQVKTQHLAQVTEKLNAVIASPQVQRQIEQHAERMVAKILTEVTNINAFTGGALPSPNAPVVESTLAQTHTAPEIPVVQAPAPTPTQPADPPTQEDNTSKKAQGDSGDTGTSSEPSSTSDSAKVSPQPRKRGRKSDRDAFCEDVVMFQATGNVSTKWAHLDDFKRYMSENMPTEDELVAARKRCGL